MRDGWARRELGEIATLKIGRTPPRKEARYWSAEPNLPFCSIKDMDGKWIFPSREGITQLAEQEGKARRAPVGSLLMSFKLTIGRLGFAGVDLFPNEAIVAISPTSSKDVSKDFLYFALASLDLTEDSSQAAKGKTLNLKSLRALQIPVPPPHEQKRIIDLIGSIDDYIAALEQQLQAGQTARHSLLSELLRPPDMSDEWREVALGDIANWRSGGTPKAGDPRFYEGGEIPWAVIADLLSDPIVSTDKSITQEGLTEIGGHLAPIGSVLVSMYGTIGRVSTAGVPLATNQAIAVGEPDESQLADGFLRLLLQTLQPQFEANARGAAQKNINQKMIKTARVQLPPIELQQQIVEIVESLDTYIDTQDSTTDAARTARQALLTDLLTPPRQRGADGAR